MGQFDFGLEFFERHLGGGRQETLHCRAERGETGNHEENIATVERPLCVAHCETSRVPLRQFSTDSGFQR